MSDNAKIEPVSMFEFLLLKLGVLQEQWRRLAEASRIAKHEAFDKCIADVQRVIDSCKAEKP